MNYCYNKGNISSTQSSNGGLIGKYDVWDWIEATFTVNNCTYLTGTAEQGVGDDAIEIEASETLPTIISVINGDNAFKEDNGNIVLNFPRN